MSLAVVYSRALTGMNAPLVEVEAHLANGLPAFNLVGLPDTEVKESRERVKAAIIQSGFEFPTKKITVNLAPADLPKDSGRFDLPIAIAILLASGQIQIPNPLVKDVLSFEFAGELALSGRLRPIKGALAMVLAASVDKRVFVLPPESALQAALLPDSQVYAADSLNAVVTSLNGLAPWQQAAVPNDCDETIDWPDFADVKGQYAVKRALEIAAAGRHHVLLSGPPGTGKSMLAQRLPSILPALSLAEQLEVASIRSLNHVEALERLPKHRPFVSPHHSSSMVALIGGGSTAHVGAISLAHRGVLFLDELPEFDRKTLESLREPLEQGLIHIARSKYQVVFPAQFQLIAAMNPCPCGYDGHPTQSCRCSVESIQRYRRKISGPLSDRIDIIMNVPALDADELSADTPTESSDTIKKRVQQAYERQMQRQGKVNAALNVSELQSLAKISVEAMDTLSSTIKKLNWSARVFHRMLRLARTCADLQENDTVQSKHVVEAIQLRRAGSNHFS